jgi:leucyl aminopeptidase (aminopeptidase T)
MFKLNLSLVRGERVLVVTDIATPNQWAILGTNEIASQLQRSLLAKYVEEIGKRAFPDNEFDFFAFPATGVNGGEPPAILEEKLLQNEVAVALTSYSITHTKARNAATSAGVRIASMPGFTAEMFYKDGVMSADYRSVAKKTIRIQNILKAVSEVEVATQSGTRLKFSINSRPVFAETGLIEKYNKACNLPAGEVACSPVEGSANGVIIIEKGWHKLALDAHAYLEVGNGLITKIEGSEKFVEHFSAVLGLNKTDELYLKRCNIAEFGIGTNPKAKRPEVSLEAEKIDGTIHIGIGTNYFMGGKVKADYHSDFVIPRPNVTFDGRVFMKKGRFIFPQ